MSTNNFYASFLPKTNLMYTEDKYTKNQQIYIYTRDKIIPSRRRIILKTKQIQISLVIAQVVEIKGGSLRQQGGR